MRHGLLNVGALALLLGLPAALAGQNGDPLLGQWTFERESPRGTMTHTLTLTIEDGALVGRMETPRGPMELTDVAFDEGVLSFTMPAPGRRGGQGGGGDRPPPTFRGTLDGDEIAGEVETPRGGQALVLRRVET